MTGTSPVTLFLFLCDPLPATIGAQFAINSKPLPDYTRNFPFATKTMSPLLVYGILALLLAFNMPPEEGRGWILIDASINWRPN